MCCSYSPNDIENSFSQNLVATFRAKMYSEFKEALMEMIDRTNCKYTEALIVIDAQTCRQLLEEASRDEQGN